MPNVIVDKDKLDVLANAISAKSGEALTLTLDEMVDAVDGISSGGGTPTLETVTTTYTATTSTQTDTITPSAGYDGIEEVDVTINAIPIAVFSVGKDYGFFTENNTRKWRMRGKVGLDVGDGDKEGWIGNGTYYGEYSDFAAVPTGTSVTPTESSQTIGGSGYMMEGAVTVNAIPSNYVGSAITSRTSSDLSASGATVTAPAGFYSSSASTSVQAGSATASASKGAVNNHSITVTPMVTRSAGYITAGTANGTAVTVSASELVSGSETKTSNGTYDVTNLASLVVNVSGGGGIGDLLSTTAIGAYSTSSTQATNMNTNIAATNVNGYDVLLVETSVDTEVANRHTATVGVAFITNSTNAATKNAAVVANAKWNAKLSSTSVTQTTSSTTAYGIYPNSCTMTTTSNGTATFAMYARYNSTRSGTINGTYTARVYGIKLCDLIGG